MRFWWIAAVVVAADQGSKALARGLADRGLVTLIPGVLGLRYAENTGMAFSLLSGKEWLLGLVSLIVIAAAWLGIRRYRLGKLASCAVMLMLGGAVGNMIDRFVTGYVVDMFEILLFRFAIFNVADVALTVGAILLGITLLWMPKEWSEKTHGDANDSAV